jgi:hypothetical protein
VEEGDTYADAEGAGRAAVDRSRGRHVRLVADLGAGDVVFNVCDVVRLVASLPANTLKQRALLNVAVVFKILCKHVKMHVRWEGSGRKRLVLLSGCSNFIFPKPFLKILNVFFPLSILPLFFFLYFSNLGLVMGLAVLPSWFTPVASRQA